MDDDEPKFETPHDFCLGRLCNQTLGNCRASPTHPIHHITHSENTIVHQHTIVKCSSYPFMLPTLIVIMVAGICCFPHVPKSASPDSSLFLLPCLSLIVKFIKYAFYHFLLIIVSRLFRHKSSRPPPAFCSLLQIRLSRCSLGYSSKTIFGCAKVEAIQH